MSVDWKKNAVWCPVCNVHYLPTEDFRFYDFDEYLENKNFTIEFGDPVEHGQKLAAIAHNFNQNKEWYPPLRALFEAINVAQKFIHFTTYGLSHSFFGALKLKSLVVPIRGIAANIHPEFAIEINDNKSEAPHLDLKLFTQNQDNSDWSMIPHQKLIVIDGIMAFKGAANMTNSGWRKAASGRDHIEVVTNIKEVVELHNKLFSPIWAEFNEINDTIEMTVEDDIPF